MAQAALVLCLIFATQGSATSSECRIETVASTASASGFVLNSSCPIATPQLLTADLASIVTGFATLTARVDALEIENTELRRALGYLPPPAAPPPAMPPPPSAPFTADMVSTTYCSTTGCGTKIVDDFGWTVFSEFGNLNRFGGSSAATTGELSAAGWSVGTFPVQGDLAWDPGVMPDGSVTPPFKRDGAGCADAMAEPVGGPYSPTDRISFWMPDGQQSTSTLIGIEKSIPSGTYDIVAAFANLHTGANCAFYFRQHGSMSGYTTKDLDQSSSTWAHPGCPIEQELVTIKYFANQQLSGNPSIRFQGQFGNARCTLMYVLIKPT